MANTGNSRAAFRKAYEDGSLKVEHINGNLVFSGNTFACKDTIKDMGGKWDRDNKVWIANASAIPAGQLGLLLDLTGDEDSNLIAWCGYVDGEATFKWLR